MPTIAQDNLAAQFSKALHELDLSSTSPAQFDQLRERLACALELSSGDNLFAGARVYHIRMRQANWDEPCAFVSATVGDDDIFRIHGSICLGLMPEKSGGDAHGIRTR